MTTSRDEPKRMVKASGIPKAAKKQKKRAAVPELDTRLAETGPKDRLARLATALQAVRAGGQVSPRTAKLLSSGVPKMAQKLVKEAAETAIEAVLGRRGEFVSESADLLYNLAVLWSALDVAPDEVWAEMDRREAMLGIAEKLPKVDENGG